MMQLQRLYDSFRWRAAGASRSTSPAGIGPLILSVLSRNIFRRAKRNRPLLRPTPDGFPRQRSTFFVTPRTRSGDWLPSSLLGRPDSVGTLSIGVRDGIFTQRFRGRV